MRYCIISMLFNNYDLLREPEEVDNEYCDYLFFTDDPNLKSEKWKVIYLPEFDTDTLTGIQKTYIFKYTFYKYIPNINDYDYVVQTDASIQIYKSLLPVIQHLDKFKYDLSIAVHPQRDNFEDEYNTWIKYRGLDPKYKELFFSYIGDTNLHGLCECTFKIYRVCPMIYNFLDDMHSIMTCINDNKDGNDQCYFTYVLSHYMDRIRVNYHSPNLYSFSKYMKVFEHGSTTDTWYNEPIYRENYYKFLNRIVRVTSDNEY